MRTGTSVCKIFWTRCRIGIIAVDRPKIISSGGNPPAFDADLPLFCPETAIPCPRAEMNEECLLWVKHTRNQSMGTSAVHPLGDSLPPERLVTHLKYTTCFMDGSENQLPAGSRVGRIPRPDWAENDCAIRTKTSQK